jgi:arginyl-tRNA synthetase
MERTLRKILTDALTSAFGTGADSFEIEIPREESHGDLSTPVAMGLARSLRKPPRTIAEQIVQAIASSEAPGGLGPVSDVFERVEVAGPGFINVTFAKPFAIAQTKRLLRERDGYLREDLGAGRSVQIEFVSANPTGPLHLGHGRGAALGAALSNLLTEAGYKVEKEYYINDAGRQVLLLGQSVFARYQQRCGLDYPVPEDGYRGDYIDDLAEEMQTGHGESFRGRDFRDVSALFVDYSYHRMLGGIRKDLDDFGVSFDTWQSERDLFRSGQVSKSIDDLRQRGHVFEEDGATWFRSTTFGDDKDRVVVKKDGEYTYFASDISYHREKVIKGFDEVVDVWGADHHGYILRVQAVVEAFGFPRSRLRVLLVQMVSLLRAGRPVQMSKRAGEFVTLREVIDEIGADTTKFLFLTRRPDSHLEVDIEVAKAQSQENPVFYVQYAHARINSIFEKARAEVSFGGEAMASGGELEKFDGSLFNDEEMKLLKKALFYPMVFKNAALAREPHRITFYLQELASLFHPYYHRHRVITEDLGLTKARLALCEAIRTVLQHGLRILGVKAPEKM